MEELFERIPALIFILYAIFVVLGSTFTKQGRKQQNTAKRAKPEKRPERGPFGETWWEDVFESIFPEEVKKTAAELRQEKKRKEATVASEGLKTEKMQPSMVESVKQEEVFKKKPNVLFTGVGQKTEGFDSGEGVSLEGDPNWDTAIYERYRQSEEQKAIGANWFRDVVRDRKSIVSAIILSEVLGPPKGR